MSSGGYTPPLTCQQLRDWVRAAQPNAQVIYGDGPCASTCTSKIMRDLVLELNSKGYLTPHTKCIGPGLKVQIVQRTARPVAPGAVL